MKIHMAPELFKTEGFFRASAPGSLFLMGEHAVLHKKSAIVFALEKRIFVTLKPRVDDVINIDSSLGNLNFKISKDVIPAKAGIQKILEENKKLDFVIHCILHYHNQNGLKTGFDLQIESEFSEKLGFGSSAAVVVATLAVLNQWQKNKNKNENEIEVKEIQEQEIEKEKLFKDALSIIQLVQGKASGADVAASIYGGMLLYRQDPLIIQPLNILETKIPLIAVYSGEKKKTIEVLKIVEEKGRLSPALLQVLYNAIEQCVDAATEILNDDNTFKNSEESLVRLGHILNIQQGLMHALGVSNEILDSIVHRLREQPGIFGAKISGAGLGDCIIALGEINHFSDELIDRNRISIEISKEGVRSW